MTEYSTQRIYEESRGQDGARVLVDRIWPRGISREDASLDHWAKSLAPSAELRKWFDHREDRFEQFRTRYVQELKDAQEAQEELDRLEQEQKVTFLYAARDESLNQAVVLAEYCRRRAAGQQAAEQRGERGGSRSGAGS